MKKKVLIPIIIVFATILLFGGLAFALSPPYPVVAPQNTEYPGLEPALQAYLLERATLALDDYAGEGMLAVGLDGPGFSQILADALNAQSLAIPKGLKFRGAFANFSEKGTTLGGGFRFLIFSLGVSARLHADVQDDNLEVHIDSVRLGRIPLPMNFVLGLAKKYAALPEDLSTLEIPLPRLGENIDLNISELVFAEEQAIFNLVVPDGVFLALDEEVLQDLEELKPQVEPILENNPKALAILEEIEFLLEQSKTTGKKVNLLRLNALAKDFSNALSPEEISQLEDVVDKDTLDFIRQHMD